MELSIGLDPTSLPVSPIRMGSVVGHLSYGYGNRSIAPVKWLTYLQSIPERKEASSSGYAGAACATLHSYLRQVLALLPSYPSSPTFSHYEFRNSLIIEAVFV